MSCSARFEITGSLMIIRDRLLGKLVARETTISYVFLCVVRRRSVHTTSGQK